MCVLLDERNVQNVPLQLALLNPIENPDLELAIVMLIVPFFVNVSAALLLERADFRPSRRQMCLVVRRPSCFGWWTISS